ncbi:DUF86 domain-containing protein [Methanospirillum stamsii]|uniref:DUF86 domain-containing protein n=1 Tax=Methanospirillum stamsii TaxID=1277351 RepID=A0A2V2MSE7_9EURY|nr:DUF86 domain-containing protein [Methanospirillum stamsii]PWR70329.1 DUF86 domain-containing protein [Methanospirillum stamsii]
MKDSRIFLLQILEFIAKIELYTEKGQNDFMISPIVQDAVIRNLEIIGEAVKNISPSVKSSYPDIPWRNIAGFRDILIHRYMGVDLDAVWNVVSSDLPLLKSSIHKILSDLNNKGN